MRPSDGSLHGIIQIHHSADWLSSDDVEDDAEDEQQEEEEEEEQVQSAATQRARSLQASDPLLPSPSSASSAGIKATAARPPAALPASQRRRARQPVQPVGRRRVMSYAEKYAMQAGIRPEANAGTQQARETARPEQIAAAASPPDADAAPGSAGSSPSASPSASHVDIMLIAPPTPLPSASCSSPAASASALPACEDAAALALRYPDYFDSLAALSDSAAATSFSAEPAVCPASVPSVSSPAYRAYTLADWRTLPRDVRLGSLGASLDPAALEARRKKQREMRQLEREVREQNARRRQREQEREREKERERERRQRAEQSDEKAETERKAATEAKSSRDRGAALASRVPKPQPAAAKASVLRKDGGKKAADAGSEQREELRLRAEKEERKEERKEQLKLSKETVSGSRRVRPPAVEAKRGGSSQPDSDALLQLVAEHEKERRKVQQIRQSLGLK